jgi:ATP-dependent Clp protease ATP-binding subunit ClpA
MFERFTDRARRVLVLAQEEARLLNHSFIGTEHILLGLIHEGEGVAAKALESLGISLEAVREKVEETIGPAGSAPTGSPPFTPRAKKVLELSLREALQLGHNYIGTEHMLLGLVREGEGVAAQVLVSLGADLTRVRQQVIQLLSGYQGREGEGDVPAGAIAQLQRRRSGFSAVPVGKQWSAQVVRTGRRPDDYANGYAELAELVIAFGFDLDDMDDGEITLSSVETTEGPGFMVRVKHRIDDETMGEGPPS